MKKEVKKFDARELRERKDTAVTMKFNGEIYREFKEIMKEQKLAPSSVLNQFMKLTNNLLKSNSGGEVCFVFETTKKETSRKKKN